MKRLRWLAIPTFLEVTAAVSLLATPAPAVAMPATAAEAPATSVTLITGDVVGVQDDGGLSVHPAKGRERTGFILQRQGGHQVVIPGDAIGLLAAGRLDRRLFDITALLEAGYDDARRDNIPMIVRYGGTAARSSAHNLVQQGRARVTAEIDVLNALVVRTAKRDVAGWWAGLVGGAPAAGAEAKRSLSGGVESIRLDGKVKLALDQSAGQIGAPTAWQAGFTGRGVSVAVLDSGIDASHPDFAGRIRENRNFLEASDAGDVDGHGTHVASIVAGSGAASGGRYKGVAPDAELLVGKVCESIFCSESAILASMEWAAEQGAKVVNMSMSATDTSDVDSLEEAVNRLSAQYGTLFVVAAGNAGPETGPVCSPSTADAALSVAASTRDDQIADFSRRGPRLGDGGNKPEISAPGVEIMAVRSAQVPDGGDDRYMRMSGTSMATPHVAGAAALLAQQHPDWTGAQLKTTLISTATALAGVEPTAQGAGRVNLVTATAAQVVPDTGSLNLGVQEWPHDDDQPVVRTVTYRNGGAVPVTLDIDTALTGPDGAPAPAPMLALTAKRITVRAGGTAAVTVTVNTSVDAPDGRYAGWVKAVPVGTAQQLTTLLSVVREVEKYDLTIRVLDRRGADAVDNLVAITSWADHTLVESRNRGESVVRLPRGEYTVGGIVETDAVMDSWTFSLLAQPRLNLTGDTNIVLDARLAKPVTATVPEPAASFVRANIGYRVTAPSPENDTSISVENQDRGFDNLFTAQLGASDTGGTFTSDISASWARKGADGSFFDSPYTYHLGWITPGSLPTGLTRRLRASDLAVVNTSYHGPAGRNGAARSEAAGAAGSLVTTEFRLPANRVDYHHGTENVRWNRYFDQRGERAPEVILGQLGLEYRAGRTYSETWNGAVLGPAFSCTSADESAGARRTSEGQIVVQDGLLVDPTPCRGSWVHRLGIGRTALYRNGDLLAEERLYGVLEANLPPEESTYRLEAAIDRTRFADVSTRISTAWTFRSRHKAAASPPVALPLMTVRYAPDVDAQHAAPSGQPFRLPILVEHQPSSVHGKVTGLAVEVSYDDGVTWREASVSGAGRNWIASVAHPAGDGHVSLRATATDSMGGKVEQTIIRGYLLRSTW